MSTEKGKNSDLHQQPRKNRRGRETHVVRPEWGRKETQKGPLQRGGKMKQKRGKTLR